MSFRGGLKTGFVLGAAAALIAKIAQTTDERAWRDAQTAADVTAELTAEEMRRRLERKRAKNGGADTEE